MTTQSDFEHRIVAAFHGNGGKAGSRSAGAPTLLLTTTQHRANAP